MTVFPSTRYHPSLPTRRVNSAAEADVAAAEGYVESPADFPPPAPVDLTKCPACGQKLPSKGKPAPAAPDPGTPGAPAL